MILKKLSIKSFGKLKNLDVELAPGLNIIYGENESGKSTIQSFIKGIFYGLRKRSKKDEISEYEKYEPWNGSEFAGIVEYEVDEKSFKAARNFATNKVSIYNELWDDVTDEFETDKKIGSLFAEKHIGMNEETFERTVFIRQLESKISESHDITDRLLNIQQTGLEETSFRNAIETLESTIKDKIGSDKASKKPINQINNEIERLLKEKYEVNLLRKETAEIEEQIKQKEHEKEKILGKINQLKDTKQSIKKESLLERYNKAKEYENSLETTENELLRLKSFENFPIHLEDRLKEIISDIKSLEQILNGKREYLEGIESKLNSLEEQLGFERDEQQIYTVLSDFKTMQDAIQEKDERQQNLNILKGELTALDERLNAVGINISSEDEDKIIELEKRKEEAESKLKEIQKIKEEAERLDAYSYVKPTLLANDNFSFEDKENILAKHRAISEYKEKLSLTSREIEKIKHDIAVNDTVLFDLDGYEALPKDIEELVMKLFDKSDNSVDLRYELDALNSKEKVLRYQLFTSIIITVISLGIFGYGVLETVLSWVIIPMIVWGIGLLLLIFSVIKLIGMIVKISRLKKEKSKKTALLPKQNDQNDSKKLNEIYKSAGVNDFKSFMKGLYSYNDAAHKAQLLNLDLELKLRYAESIKDQLNNIQKEISDVLSYFGVKHNPYSVNEMDILAFEEKCNEFLSTGNLNNNMDFINNIETKRMELLGELKRVTQRENIQLDYASSLFKKMESDFEELGANLKDICERLSISESSELLNKIESSQEIKKEIDFKNNEAVQFQDSIFRLIEKIESVNRKIKAVLTQYAIEFQEETLIDESHIENLKEKSNVVLKTSGEISNLKALSENISSDIVKTEQELSEMLREKENILDEAVVHTEDEFFEGCRNRIRINELVDEKWRLLNILDELLKGEDSQSLLEKIAATESSSVYTGEFGTIEDIDGQIEEFKQEVEKLNADIINLKNDASNKLSGRLELNKIVEQIEYFQARKLELESAKYSLEIAVDVLNETAKQMQKDFAPRLQNEISKIIRQITAGKYSQVRANEKLNLNVLDDSSGKIINIEKLSMGTIEQFYLALRIALSNVLGEKSEELPIIIDEAFVQYDDLRMLNILEFLLEVSENRQILIFTCQSREVEAMKKIGTDNAKIIELSSV